MSETERVLSLIESHKAEIFGSIQFYGDWFGRPYDNRHQVKFASASGNVLTIVFNEEEKLQLFEPSAAEMGHLEFIIRCAAGVLWEWFYYGRPKIQSNLYYRRYSVDGGAINAESNVDWYKFDPKTDVSKPAVRISL